MSTRNESFIGMLRSAAGVVGVSLTEAQLAAMSRHFEMVCDANRRFNLTRITDPASAAIRHYADSLALLAAHEEEGPATLLDVGTGAGFPAIPIAVCRPRWQLTAIDGRTRKAAFVNEVAQAMGLTNLVAVHAHSDHWESDRVFDLVTMRAVASLPKLLRMAERHLAIDGVICAYKTRQVEAAEWETVKAVLRELRLESARSYDYELCCGTERLERRILFFRRLGRPGGG